MIRLLDIFFSILAIIFFSPLLVAISVLLLFTGEKKVFFLQERIGLNHKKFNLIKFATMLENSPNIGSKNITLKNDNRVLPFGKFLRKYKINELPQLFNILYGHMSIVGPRPLTRDIFNLYDKKTKQILYSIKPGLTGVSSIFFRNEEIFFTKKKELSNYKKYISPFKSKLEKWYIKNNGLGLYFACIISTAVVIIFKNFNLLEFFYKTHPKPKKFFKNIKL